MASARPVKLEEVKFAAALFAAAALASPSPAAATPLICIDPGHDATPDLSLERIGPGSTTYKIKDGGGAPGEAKVVLQIGFKLRTLLLERGYRVAMTRTTDEFTYGNRGNIARAKFCNRRGSALMVTSSPRADGPRSSCKRAWSRPRAHSTWGSSAAPT